MVDVPVAAEQPQFLARERQKQNSAPRLRLPRKPARHFDHARGARCVIVRAGVNGSQLVGRERVLVAQAQVVVMRPDDDILGRLAAQITGDIVHRLGVVNQIHGQIDFHLSQRERARLQVFVNLIFDLFEVAALRAQPLFGRRGLHLYEENPGVARAAGGAEGFELVHVFGTAGPGMRRHVVDQDHAARPVHLRVHHLVEKRGVRGQLLAFENAARVVLLRLMPQDQHHLAGDVHTRVVVVTIFLGRDAVTGKHHRPAKLAVG